ncbi:hypothetical protein [uncultured Stenotrophomonas sp.]|uniref:hypothetical protein n=1 Tax=uncultured Stenotrophomonas sp. TaxID=165438 RepID=UPI0025E0A156|nr:hypothetical protein [uncultured Stenotrophomonas sp.]
MKEEKRKIGDRLAAGKAIPSGCCQPEKIEKEEAPRRSVFRQRTGLSNLNHH